MDFSLVVQKVKSGGLSIIQEAGRMVAFVGELSEPAVLKECKAQATAILAYLSGRKDLSVQEHNAALKVKLKVEHRMGEVLAATVNHKGGRPAKNSDNVSQLIPDVLGDDDSARKQSSRAQQLARVPWEELEASIDGKTERNEKASQSRVVKELLQEQQREDNRRLVESLEPRELPDDELFPTIVLDPPWDWGDEGDHSQLGRARPEYATLSFEGVRDFRPLGDGRGVGDLAERNAHLYLWITNRSLPKGFALLDHWGFRYVTCLTWCKPHFGMGNYFRGSTEQILFGVKGSLPLLRSDAGTWFQADRPGRHSEKPEAFYQLVETCSPGPWLELFARKRRKGWVHVGAEV